MNASNCLSVIFSVPIVSTTLPSGTAAAFAVAGLAPAVLVVVGVAALGVVPAGFTVVAGAFGFGLATGGVWADSSPTDTQRATDLIGFTYPLSHRYNGISDAHRSRADQQYCRRPAGKCPLDDRRGSPRGRTQGGPHRVPGTFAYGIPSAGFGGEGKLPHPHCG